MNHKMKLLGVAMLGTALFTGCGVIDKVLLPKPTPQIEQVPRVQSTTITNPATGLPMTTYATNWVTITNQVYSGTVNPQVTQGITTAQQYTGMLPPPYSDAANLLLLLAGGAAAFYAKTRTTQLNKSNTMLGATVTAIESVPDSPQVQAVKDAVATHSTAAGVAGPLDAVVQTISNQIN